MARLTGPEEGVRAVYLRNGLVRAQGRRLTLYADSALTTLADVRTVDGGLIPGSTLLVDTSSRIPLFQYPDSVDVVYTSVDNGPVIPLYARYDSRIDQLYQMVLDINVGGSVTGVAELRSDVDTLTTDVTVLAGEIVGKQDELPSGSATQFLRGSDKTFVTVAKTDVGLGNVDNTTDLTKPLSTAATTALNAKVSKGELAVNAKDYSAVGDGVADDTGALTAAATAAVANGLREIYLPPGTYKHTGLNLTVSLRGAGRSRTVLQGPQITMSTTNTMLSDIKLISSSPTAVLSANAQRIRLTNVEVDHEVGVTDHLAWNAYNIDQMQVTGCKFNIGGLQIALCDDFYIAGNFWDCQYSNVNEPCHISGQSSGVFTGNTVTNTITDGVDLYSSGHRCVISDNRFIGLRGAAGLECKVTLSDDAANSSSPGNVLDATIISNNVFRDFNSTTTSTRNGIYATFIDNRAVKTWNVANTNRAVLISNNILEDFNAVDPGNGAIVSYQGIVYTGHNGAIRGNIIKNLRGWNGAVGEGISLSATSQGVADGWRSVGLSVQDNTIVGVESGYGIRTGSLEQCLITGNVIRGDEDTGIVTRFGVDIVAGASLTYTSISNNSFHCNYATGQAIRAASGVILSHCTINDNIIRDCGIALAEVQDCTFIGNSINSVVNGQAFSVAGGATTSKGNVFIGNHLTMNSTYGMSLINMDGFVVDGCAFRGCARGLLLAGTIKNGIISNNVSTEQTFGLEFPLFSSVSATDQATITLGTNRVTNAGGSAYTTGARRRTAVADANYTVLNSDALIAYTSLSASRVVTLPAQGATLPAAQSVTVKDESGACSSVRTITIAAPSGGTINGASSLVLNTPYAHATLYTNGTSWFTQADAPPDFVNATNIHLGTSAQVSITGGTNNVAVGTLAQNALTTGASNIAIGRSSQALLTTGAANTAVGDGTLSKITTANFNTAVGSEAQTNVTTGGANTGIGGNVQFGLTSGSSNVAVGHRAAYGANGLTANATTTANQQTVIGYESGQADATQTSNITTVGYRAVAAGTASTAIGHTSAATGFNSTALGNNAVASGQYSLALGSTVSATGTGSVAIGRDSTGLAAGPTQSDEIALGTLRHKTRIAYLNDTANVKLFRLPLDTDDTAAVTRAVATGARRIYFPPGNYTVSVPQSESLGSWTGVNGVYIDAGEATITNTVLYGFGALFTSIFKFDNCDNIRVEVGSYSGVVLADPGTDFGYRGEIFVKLDNNCDGAVIHGTISNVRYGVQSGDYTDGRLGNCKNINVRLRTFMVGYPVALYLAEGVRLDIDADDSHRAAYIAGCHDVRGVIRWKDQWSPADTVVLITDASLVTGYAGGSSRGCQDVDLTSIDKGSTKFYVTSYATGIALSWANPDTRFDNIKLRVYSKSTNSLSQRIGMFRILSGITNLGYPAYSTYNWLSSIVFRNVTVSGIMDHSEQTSDGNVTGDISIRAYDYLKTPNNYPTIDNLVFEDLVIHSSIVNKVPLMISAPLITGAGITFRRVSAPNTVVRVETNNTTAVKFEECTFLRLEHAISTVTGTAQGTGAKTRINGSTFADYQLTNMPTTHSVEAVNSSLAGASSLMMTKHVTVSLTGATTTLTDIIPANSLLIGVQGRLTQAIGTATGFQVGVSGTLTRYADVSATTAGTTFTLSNYAVAETSPRFYGAATSLLITAKTSNFSAGQMRLVLHYTTFNPPTV